MRLYLDDDSAAALLVHLLRQAGHDVRVPLDAGLSGEDDAVHLTYAVKDDRGLPTGNHRDFRNLNNLLMQAQGHHPGILVVRHDNDPKRDLTPRESCGPYATYWPRTFPCAITMLSSIIGGSIG